MEAIRLKPGRERSLQKRHPWVFSGAIAEVVGQPEPGETVDVIDHHGAWLAKAAFSPISSIRARVWTWSRDEQVSEDFIAQRVRGAIGLRESFARDPELDAYREVYAEADGLPGLMVDRYADFRVVQFLTVGAERWREAVLSALVDEGEIVGVIERSDVDARGLEGLEPRKGLLWGQAPPAALQIREHGLRFRVDLLEGQKTGFYLDQRENRQLLRKLVPPGDILDCFSYTGGFSVAALTGGAASVVLVDSSAPSLKRARENLELNSFALDRCALVEANVFEELRRMRDRGRSFDAIVLDPPRFASVVSHAQRAARGYKDINLLAFKLLRPGGLLFTFSCSGGVGPELFQSIVAGAALDAGAEARILVSIGQPGDHPVSLRFPESRYLKGLVCQVTGFA